MEEKALLVFRRWPRWVYKLRCFDIVIDEQKVGSIGDGQEVRIPVSPGRHVVELRVSWILKSEIQVVEVKQGEQALLDCGTPLVFYKFLLPLGVMIICQAAAPQAATPLLFMLLQLATVLLSLYYFSCFRKRGKSISLKEPKKLPAEQAS